MAHLGFTVDSTQVSRAEADLNRLVATSGQTEKGVEGVSRAYRQMQTALAPLHATLQSIERHTASLSSSSTTAAAAVGKLDAAAGSAAKEFVAMDRGIEQAMREMVELRAASTGAASAINAEAAALRLLNDELRENSTLPRPSSRPTGIPGDGARQAHTTNLMFQAQDIAMMTAMGQNPMMLAMQQGSQVGPILQQMGGGRAAIAGIGTALGSLVSPINLITLGVIGFGAAGVQALMGIMRSTDDATSSLEKHEAWLDRVLVGYDDARDAANSYLERALQLPREAAQMELQSGLEDALTALETKMQSVIESQGRIARGDTSGANQFILQVQQWQTQLESGQITLDDLVTNLTRVKLDDDAPASARAFAEQMLVSAQNAATAEANVRSVGAAINSLDRNVVIRLNVQREFAGAIEGINDLYMDPRNQFDIAREQLEQQAQIASETAQSYGQAAQLGADYQRVLESINAAESEANEKANERAASAAARPGEQWRTANENFQQRIDQQRMEMDLLGKSTFEIERQRAAFDLLNQAKQAGMQVTEPLTQQINQMASEYASLAAQAEQAALAQAQFDEQLNFYRGTFTGFFSELKTGLQDGQSMWEALGNAGANALDRIADRALSMAADGLFDMLFGSLMGGITGGMGGGQWGVAGGFGRPGIFGIPGMATGGTVGRAGLSWVGERGPELLRLPQGAQVIPNGPSLAMAANQNSRGDLHLHINGSGLNEQQLSRAIANGIREYDAGLAPKVEAKFRTMQNDPRAADGAW